MFESERSGHTQYSSAALLKNLRNAFTLQATRPSLSQTHITTGHGIVACLNWIWRTDVHMTQDIFINTCEHTSVLTVALRRNTVGAGLFMP